MKSIGEGQKWIVRKFSKFSSAPSLSLHCPPREYNYFCTAKVVLKTLPTSENHMGLYQVQ